MDSTFDPEFLQPPERFLYFAYGSNLYSPRLRYRVPSCEFVSLAALPNYTLAFHKRSKDGSSKCDAFPAPDGQVLGVIYRIKQAEADALRRAEGATGKSPGYVETEVVVTLPDGSGRQVTTYRAHEDHIVHDQVPYSWYHDFVLMGCSEHRFPRAYIEEFVLSTRAIADPDQKRDADSRAQVKGDPIWRPD